MLKKLIYDLVNDEDFASFYENLWAREENTDIEYPVWDNVNGEQAYPFGTAYNIELDDYFPMLGYWENGVKYDIEGYKRENKEIS